MYIYEETGLDCCHCIFASSNLSFELATQKWSAEPWYLFFFVFTYPKYLTSFDFLATYIHIMPMQEKSEVFDGKVEEELQLVDGKVDWKGRRALKNKHGGMNASFLILGND